MINKLRDFLHANRELISYAFFGGLTTIVNYAVYFPLYNYFNLSAVACNIIAWFIAVLFAFVTNKYCVFKSKERSFVRALNEMLRFFSCRAGTGIAESLILLITVDILNWNGNICKIIIGFFVTVANYFGTKFFVFNKK